MSTEKLKSVDNEASAKTGNKSECYKSSLSSILITFTSSHTPFEGDRECSDYDQEKVER